MRRAHLLILLGLFFWIAGLHSQQGSAIQGNLTRLGSNEPVPNGFLELREADAPPPGPAGPRAAARPLPAAPYTAVSDKDGRFFFRNVAPGRYRLSATRNGFVTASYGQRRSDRPGEILTLTAGQSLSAIEIALTPTAVITGHIYDKSGQPAANIGVSARQTTFAGGNKGLTNVRSARTNDLGEYRIFDLPPGQYYVTATPLNSTNVAFTYGPDRFTDVYARVRMENEPPPAAASNPASVTYPDKTEPFAGSLIDLRPGAEIQNVNMTVGDVVHTTRVRATVLDSETGQPARVGQFNLISLLENLNRGAMVNGAQNTFDLGFVPPGPYMFAVDAPDRAGRHFFDVKDQEEEDIVLRIGPGFAIDGKITVEGAGGADTNLTGLQVELRLDIPLNASSSTSTAVPTADGSFHLQKVLPGTYLIGIPAIQYQRAQPPRLAPALQNVYVKTIRLGSEDGISGKLHLDAAPREPLEIVISTNAATLEGRVIQEPGQPINAITVALIPDSRGRPETFRNATSDNNGQFRFDRVPPGSYKVFAWDQVENNAWRSPEFLAGDESRGIAVDLAEGAHRTVDIPIIRR